MITTVASPSVPKPLLTSSHENLQSAVLSNTVPTDSLLDHFKGMLLWCLPSMLYYTSTFHWP